ncbi:MAG: SGNH/GDSL hydrolase family protein [Deltaproteobacteria bacterium]|nr:SGNH/GDSL hydrolase family protein [Deltaproteobacteria bacterium]MBN2673125.1 SGNH/GDSL hydrolase family protein [Deltaproteobacteria bacterium]
MTDTPQTAGAYLAPFFEKLRSGLPVRIVALGDSLTYGWEASFSYFDLFISKLRVDYCGVTIDGYNDGVCGDTAAGGQRRISDLLLRHEPNIVIVQFGINDLYAGVPLSEYSTSLGAIARKCLRDSALPLFISSGPLLLERDQQRINEYYDAMKIVAERYHVPMVDISAYWLQHTSSLRAFYFPDGVHPNDDGYRIMADALYAFCTTQ